MALRSDWAICPRCGKATNIKAGTPPAVCQGHPQPLTPERLAYEKRVDAIREEMLNR